VDARVDLGSSSAGSFWLEGTSFDIPSYDNADDFAHKLVRRGLLCRDALVSEVLQGRAQYVYL